MVNSRMNLIGIIREKYNRGEKDTERERWTGGWGVRERERMEKGDRQNKNREALLLKKHYLPSILVKNCW